MNELRGIVIIWYREMLRYWRNRTRAITSVTQPLLFLAIFGMGLQNSIQSAAVGGDFLKFMYPGIIAMGTMGIALTSAISIVYDREFGFLKEILVAPVSRVSIAIAKALGGTTNSLAQAAILLLLAPLIGVHLSVGSVLALLGLAALLAFAISGLGILLASRMKSTESFGLVMQFLLFPLFFLSGAFFPLQSIPGWMRALTNINPLAYGVDAFRSVLLGSNSIVLVHPLYVNILFLLGFSAVFMGLAVWQFQKTE